MLNEQEQEQLILENMPLVTYIVKKYFYYNEDYVSIGTIGLVKAVKTYDNTKGYKLSTYASRCIYNEICMQLRKNPVGKEISFDNQLNETLDYEDVLLDTETNVEEEIIKKEELELLRENIKKLNKVERYIIIHSYGLFGKDRLTQRQIADKLGYTQCHISRLHKKILMKLRKMMEE